ncbi:alanyl-tRNA editing protein [Anaerocolumna xylanovorans]|nr:alanyl-tRNA editing protein [Anaerocolumna xylanovorans]
MTRLQERPAQKGITMIEKTIKLYDENSYLSEFSAKVLSCREITSSKGNKVYEVILDATAFFPEGGGQACDAGYLNEIEVTDVQEKEEIIYHTLTAPVTEGLTVKGEINHTRRFDFMQQHTGEHILSGLVHKHFGYDNVGFHLGTDIVTIDFSGVLKEEDLRTMEEKANEAVFQNIPVTACYPSDDVLKAMNYRSKKELSGAVRIVTIEGIDTCACCAPHVKFTGEVGLIKIVSFQSYKGGTRLEILCGGRALRDYNRKEKNIQNISVLLSAKIYDTSEAVKRLKEEKSALEGKLSSLSLKLLSCKAESVPFGAEPYAVFDSEIEDNQLRNYANLLKERREGIIGIFIPTIKGTDPAKNSLNQQEYRYILCSKNTDIRPLGSELNKTFNGRGGGSKEMVQGSVTGNKDEIESFINNYKD